MKARRKTKGRYHPGNQFPSVEELRNLGTKGSPFCWSTERYMQPQALPIQVVASPFIPTSPSEYELRTGYLAQQRLPEYSLSAKYAFDIHCLRNLYDPLVCLFYLSCASS